jgi:hypothetical protein
VHVVSLLRERAEEDERAAIEKNFNKIRRQQTGRGGLLNFVRHFWHALEPKSRKLVEGWPLEAICNHLEALTFGDIQSNRLLINVPPGFMKSLLVDVFWPAWEWGPCNMPYLPLRRVQLLRCHHHPRQQQDGPADPEPGLSAAVG